MSERTDEQTVKEKWPDAVVGRYAWERQIYRVRKDGSEQHLSSWKGDELQAWADAASRIRGGTDDGSRKE